MPVNGLSAEQWSKLTGLAMVLALHGALLYAAMSYKLIPPPQEAGTLFVNLINPPKKVEPPPEPAKPLPKKVTLVKPQPILQPIPESLLVSNAPVVTANEPVAPPPPVVPAPPAPEPVVEAPAKPTTVTLSSDLSVSCPQRSMPNYPAASRRLNEHGLVVLRVELDETGHITTARVETSSGYKRLDDAGLAIVKTWHCNAATRQGKAVRAVALQPFDFILEGR
jgi:protein TonB